MQRMGLTQRWQRCGFAKTLWLVEPTPPSTTIPNLVSENTYSRQLGEEERSNPSALGQRRGAWHSETSQWSRRPTHLYLDSRADVGEVTRKSKRGHLRTGDRCCAPGRHARGARSLARLPPSPRASSSRRGRPGPARDPKPSRLRAVAPNPLAVLPGLAVRVTATQHLLDLHQHALNSFPMCRRCDEV